MGACAVVRELAEVCALCGVDLGLGFWLPRCVVRRGRRGRRVAVWRGLLRGREWVRCCDARVPSQLELPGFARVESSRLFPWARVSLRSGEVPRVLVLAHALRDAAGAR